MPIVFKAIVLGLLGWQLIQFLRKKKEQPQVVEPTYIIVPADQLGRVPDVFEQRVPPPSYYPSVKSV